MKTQAATVDEARSLSGHRNNSRETWRTARQDLLAKEREIARLRDQLRAQRWTGPLTSTTIGRANEIAKLSAERSSLFVKQAGYRLLGFVGPLMVAVFLLLQLQALPNSSLSYSLLSAAISLLFNFSSSALTRTS